MVVTYSHVKKLDWIGVSENYWPWLYSHTVHYHLIGSYVNISAFYYILNWMLKLLFAFPMKLESYYSVYHFSFSLPPRGTRKPHVIQTHLCIHLCFINIKSVAKYIMTKYQMYLTGILTNTKIIAPFMILFMAHIYNKLLQH